jgi:hypothetical protein
MAETDEKSESLDNNHKQAEIDAKVEAARKDVENKNRYLRKEDQDAIVSGIRKALEGKSSEGDATKLIRDLPKSLDKAAEAHEGLEKAFRNPRYAIVKEKYKKIYEFRELKDMPFSKKAEAWKRLEEEIDMIEKVWKHLDIMQEKGLISASKKKHKVENFIEEKDMNKQRQVAKNLDGSFRVHEREKLFRDIDALPGPIKSEAHQKLLDMPIEKAQRELAKIETERKDLAEAYRDEIIKVQRENQHKEPLMKAGMQAGLSFFSTEAEGQSGSSAQRYTKWFENELTLGHMRKMVKGSDHNPANNPKRRLLVNVFAEILTELPEDKREAARQEFNKAEITGRQMIIGRYGGTARLEKQKATAEAANAEKTEADKELSNESFVEKTASDIILSNEHRDVQIESETAAVVGEAVKRRKRAEHLLKGEKTAGGLMEEMREQEGLLHQQQIIEESTSDTVTRDEDGAVSLSLVELRNQDAVRQSLLERQQIGLGEANTRDANVELWDASWNKIGAEEAEKTMVVNTQNAMRAAVLPFVKKAVIASGRAMDDDRIAQIIERQDFSGEQEAIIGEAA